MKTTTKFTPNELIFGTSVNHDFQFLIKPESAKSDKTHHETINELLIVQEKLIKIARDNQHEHDVYVVSQRSQGTFLPGSSKLKGIYSTEVCLR